MKLYVISDIHGASPALDKFFERTGDLKDGKLILLGDIYNHGPRNPLPDGYAPMKVAEKLNSVKDKLTAVQGNCDSEVDSMISRFAIFGGAEIRYKGRTFKFTHGHKCNPTLPASGLKEGDVVFYGHFHRPEHTVVDGVHYVCVGALGMHPDDAVCAYAVVDGKKVKVVALDDGKEILSFEL